MLGFGGPIALTESWEYQHRHVKNEDPSHKCTKVGDADKKNSLIIVIINMTKDQNLSMCTTNRVEIGYI